jgi:hypothetical protein
MPTAMAKKRLKPARRNDAPSGIAFLFFGKADSQSNCDAMTSFVSLLDYFYSA